MRWLSQDNEPHRHYHLAQGLHPLTSWLQNQGFDYLPLLKKAGIPPEALSQPEFCLSPSQELGFTTAVYTALNRPEMGLLIGPRYHLSSYGMLGLAAMTSSTLEQCCSVMLEHITLTWTYFKTIIYSEGETSYVEMHETRDLGDCLRYMIDRDLTAVYAIAKEALERDIEPQRVEFKYPTPANTQAYRDAFGCPVDFGADRNRISFNLQWMLHPLPKAEAETSRIFLAQCQTISQELGKHYSFTEHVRYALLNSSNQSPSLEAVAKQMNTTPRTVQRKLASEGIRFQNLLNNVRASLSCEYLRTSALSIEEIAARLGYNDSAAFSNAFKRWKGVPPSRYRQAQLNGGPQADFC